VFDEVSGIDRSNQQSPIRAERRRILEQCEAVDRDGTPWKDGFGLKGSCGPRGWSSEDSEECGRRVQYRSTKWQITGTERTERSERIERIQGNCEWLFVFVRICGSIIFFASKVKIVTIGINRIQFPMI
jgi:hypothetical protein